MTTSLSENGGNGARRGWLFAFSAFAVGWTFILLFAGGFTTSIDAGMVFPDWPLSHGSVNPPGWLQDRAMMAEHSHRLLGAKLGLLAIVLAAWIHRVDERRWMRRLGWILLGLVVFQGLLGGLRVLLDRWHIDLLGTTGGQLFRVLHGCLAQVYFALLVIAAAALSPWWRRAAVRDGVFVSVSFRRLTLALVSLVAVQLVVGAVMRHNGAGLSIPTFPLTPDGGLVPPAWTFGIAVHFAHRALALVITLTVMYWVWRAWNDATVPFRLRIAASALLVPLGVQILLGALVIWSGRHPHVATAHVLVGAAFLASCALLAVLVHRPEAAPARAAAGAAWTPPVTATAES